VTSLFDLAFRSATSPLLGYSLYLDRTFAQWIGSAKGKSKSEVTHSTSESIWRPA